MSTGAVVVLGVGSVAICAAAALAAQSTPKIGMVYAYAQSGPPALRAEPRDGAPEVAHPPNGARVRFVEIVGDEAKPSWYHVDQLGMSSGWLEASQARSEAPKRKAGSAVDHVDLGDLHALTDTVITSAARGIDSRVLRYGAEASRNDALQQLADLTKAIDRQMSDVPYTGQEKGNHRPGSRFNHTADGRVRDAQAFHDAMSDGGAK